MLLICFKVSKDHVILLTEFEGDISELEEDINILGISSCNFYYHFYFYTVLSFFDFALTLIFFVPVSILLFY